MAAAAKLLRDSPAWRIYGMRTSAFWPASKAPTALPSTARPSSSTGLPVRAAAREAGHSEPAADLTVNTSLPWPDSPAIESVDSFREPSSDRTMTFFTPSPPALIQASTGSSRETAETGPSDFSSISTAFSLAKAALAMALFKLAASSTACPALSFTVSLA
ncbi:hypothetical protein D3C75_910090 [compost metagenome]